MAKCEDCGCTMDGGFCTNCHEEIFIQEQYSDLGEEVPVSIVNKATEHINNTKKRRVKEIKLKNKKQYDKHREYFGE